MSRITQQTGVTTLLSTFIGSTVSITTSEIKSVFFGFFSQWNEFNSSGHKSLNDTIIEPIIICTVKALLTLLLRFVCILWRCEHHI